MARLYYRAPALRSTTGALAASVGYVVYTDSAGTVLADVSATLGGSAIAGSAVTTSSQGLLEFYGPPAGTTTLYVRCPAQPSLGVQRIDANADDRLDILEAAGSVATHEADTTAIHGITDTTQLALRNAANTFTGIQTFDLAARFKNHPWFDVTHPTYGAVADGATDSGAAINLAIAAAHAIGGGIVQLPAGTLRIETTIKPKGTTWLRGAGEGKTILKLKNSANTPVIGKDAGALQYMTLSDFSIDGNRDNNTSGGGILLDTMFVQCSIRNVNVYLASDEALKVTGADEFELRHFWAGNCDKTGIWLEDVSELRASDIASERSYNPAAGASQYANIYLLRCDQTKLTSVGIEQTETLTNGQGRGIIFDSCTTFSLDTMYAYGIGGTGSRDAAVYITSATVPGRTYGYILQNLTKNNYTNVFTDVVGGYGEPSDYLRWYSDDFTPKTMQVRDGNLYLLNARLQGFSGGDININLGNAKTGQTTWFFGTASPVIEAMAVGGFKFNAAASIRSGTGTPEGAVTAAIGSVFLRSDGSAGTSAYIKESGAGNTGWVALAAAGSLATHEADTTAIHGITDTSQITLLNASLNTFSGRSAHQGNLLVDGNTARLGVGFTSAETGPDRPLQVRNLTNGAAAVTDAGAIPLGVQQKSTSTANFVGFLDSSGFLIAGVGATGIGHGAGTGDFAVHTRGGAGFGTAKLKINGDNTRINGRLGVNVDPAGPIDVREGGSGFGAYAGTGRTTRGLEVQHGKAPVDADLEDVHGMMILGIMAGPRQSGASPGAVFGIEAQAETLSGAGINPIFMVGVNALVNYRSDQTVANSRAVSAQVQIDDVSGTRAGTLTNTFAVYADDVFEIGTLGTIVNSYGVYAKQQTRGTTLNIPIYSEGDICAAAAGRLGLGVTAFGGTVGNAIGLKAATTVPSSNVTGTHILYVDPADNKLKSRGPSGTINVIGNP